MPPPTPSTSRSSARCGCRFSPANSRRARPCPPSSVITTKRAYDELEREGLIDTVGGKGTFVASPNMDFLREKRVAAVEAKLREAMKEAEAAGISAKDLKQMLDLLLEPDHA